MGTRAAGPAGDTRLSGRGAFAGFLRGARITGDRRFLIAEPRRSLGAPPAALEVPTISGLPNMAQIEQRLNAHYAQSAQSTKGVEFTPPSISGTTLSAAITYADDQLLSMKIGSTEHRIKTITITRDVDGKTIPTRGEY